MMSAGSCAKAKPRASQKAAKLRTRSLMTKLHLEIAGAGQK
jgi:hypothetical protein